jgi:NADH-ubiquinone oxidoreductase chain 1
LGGIRARTQTVSYEVALTIVLLIIIIYTNNFNFLKYDENVLLIILPIVIIWLLIIICETNRAPFDFAEGERELISGFNIEYGRRGFVLYFLREYNIIIFFCLFTCLIFNISYLLFFILLFILISLRTSFPRFRYDFLQEFI